MGKIAAFITGAIVATAPIGLYHVSHNKADTASPMDVAMQAMLDHHATAKQLTATLVPPAPQQVEVAAEPAPPSGLEIYAQKIGLPFSHTDTRPDEAIMSAMLLGDIISDNVYVETRERTSAAGVESITLYTADILLQKRIYREQPNAELIYSVECTYGAGETSSRIMYRNLGEDIDQMVLSDATKSATINAAIVNSFCDDLKASDAVAGMTPTPAPAAADDSAPQAAQSEI